MAESIVCVLVPLLGIYVVSLLIFLRLWYILDFLEKIRDLLKEEVSEDD